MVGNVTLPSELLLNTLFSIKSQLIKHECHSEL